MSKDALVWFVLYILRPVVEITVIAAMFYTISVLIRGTRAAQVLKGLGIVLILFFISQRLEFLVINWLLTKVFAISVIAFLILFQPELRRALAKIGQNRVFGNFLREEQFVLDIVKAVHHLALKRIGALIVIERNAGLGSYVESGVFLDARLTVDLLISLFMPTTPLHDGSVIVQGERIAAAGCLLPLTDNPLQQRVGTRHRAALGVSEETDAVAIVVSEETGIVSVAVEGQMIQIPIKEETQYKIVSLILAIIVWFYAMGEMNHAVFFYNAARGIEQRVMGPIAVNVLQSAAQAQKRIQIEPSEVMIEISGPKRQVQELNDKDLLAFVNIAHFSEGAYSLIAEIDVPGGVRIISKPNPIKVTISAPVAPTPIPVLPLKESR